MPQWSKAAGGWVGAGVTEVPTVPTRSHWRAIADRVIAAVLAALPAAATAEEKRKAVDASYPFGERKHLPYKHWLAARRAALGGPPRGAGGRPGVGFVLTFLGEGVPHLRVECGWCDGRVAGGCLACLPLCTRLQALVTEEDWRAFRRGDPPPAGVVRDWLMDRGVEVPEPAPRRKARRRKKVGG